MSSPVRLCTLLLAQHFCMALHLLIEQAHLHCGLHQHTIISFQFFKPFLLGVQLYLLIYSLNFEFFPDSWSWPWVHVGLAFLWTWNYESFEVYINLISGGYYSPSFSFLSSYSPRGFFENWIANPCYLKEQPPVMLGRRDNQLSMSETGPNLVNWSDPLNGGRWYNFDPRAGGYQFNLAEMPTPEI
jgi:hypothetical protein